MTPLNGRRRPDREAAEETAIAALMFIAGDDDRLHRFLDLTGLSPETLRAAAADPEFLPQVLSHIRADQSLLLAFAANLGQPPESIVLAADRLCGPSETWSSP